jgi:uncharacterized 2Fe-2S/4Fe-4S cluster protein (DUF4445 family)
MNRTIKIYRSGKLLSTTSAEDGATLLECVTAAGHFLDAPCGGKGRCGKCLVRLTPGGEEVKACRTYVEGDTEIYLPEDKDMKIAESGNGAHEQAYEHEGPLGVAIDIGTTTVVAHLTDIPTKKRAGHRQRRQRPEALRRGTSSAASSTPARTTTWS